MAWYKALLVVSEAARCVAVGRCLQVDVEQEA